LIRAPLSDVREDVWGDVAFHHVVPRDGFRRSVSGAEESEKVVELQSGDRRKSNGGGGAGQFIK
jgi:hypothetical protein